MKIFKVSVISLVLLVLMSGNAFSQCLTYTIQDVSCNGGSDGSVTITVNPVGSLYNFSVFGAFGSRSFTNSVSNTHTFTNLPAEANLIIVGQFKVGASFLSCPPFFAAINEPTAISVSGSVTDILCNGGNTGAIDITPSGGNPGAYTYSWNNGPITQDISSLTAGNYTVIVTDSKGCKDTTSYTVAEPAGISIPGTVTPINCNAGASGAIDITPSGGTGAYTYLWSNGAVSQDISGLMAGTYTVTVKDANLCSKNASFTLTQPTAISIPGVVTNNICNGGNSGTVDITPTGGTGAYTYLWSNGAVTQDLAGLIAGTYTVTVKDANLCSQNASFTITEPAAITIPGVVTNTICNGGSTGAIDITPAGGTGAYTYLWSNGAVTQDIAGLIAGTYTITVKDANLCSQNTSFTITQPAVISIPGVVTNALCNGGNNGAVDITPAGGTGAYTYLWSNGAVTQDIAGLIAGTYTVTVKDANLCSKNASFTVTQPSAITIPGIITQVSCNAGSNGAIDITPANGVGAYTYLWSNGAISQDIAGLIAGTYTVTVKDANLCSKNASFTITQPTAITILGTITNNVCNGGNAGAIDITPAGGTGAYTYLWSNGAVSQDIAGLIAGTYTVTVKDANLCSKNASFTITEPAAITIPGVITNNICNGGSTGAIDITPANGTAPYTYLWSNGAVSQDIAGLIAGTYTVTVKDANLCSKNASFTITQPAVISIPGVTTPVSCNAGNNGAVDITPAGGTGAYTYLWSNGAVSQDIAGLIAGTYTVTVKDANLCSKNASFTVTQPSAITIPGIITQVSCNAGSNGAIDITPANGVGAYTYLWSNGAISQDIAGLIAGTYTVTVKDANFCSQNASFTITQPTAITIPGTITNNVCNGGNAGAVDITPAGGTGAYTYLWSNGAVSQDIAGLIAGTYTVAVKDANLCSKNASFTITEPAAITIPGVVTNNICNGGSTGAIDITPANGTAPYTYLWSNGAVSQDIAGLIAGTYTVTVKDANLCSKNASFTVNDPAVISIPGVTTPVSCNAGNNGAVDITPAGGTGAYTYLWSNGAVSQDIAGLIAGTYTVTVKDANLCSQNASFTITQPSAITIPGILTQVSCNAGSNGAIDITPANGTSPYTYSWSNGAVSQDIAGLVAGNYTVTVTDANLCSNNASFIITQPAIISIPGIINHNICNGGNIGDIDITPAGGTGAYAYSWTNGASSQDISALTAGTYTVTITDANLCSQNASFTVTQPAAIAIPGIVTDNICNGGSVGAIDITPADGTGAYTYLWSNGAVSQDIAGLIAGSYTVSVTDANLCSQNASFTVNEPAVISIPGVTTPVSCNAGNNGAVDITPAGGTGAYTYLWSSGAVTEDIAGLIAGTYTVTVKDANLCSQNASFTITQPTAIAIPGITTQVSCNAGSNGAIDITPANGTGPYTYSWSNGAVSEDIAGLAAGNYTVTVTDANLCSNNASFIITQPAIISIPGIINHNICNGGNIGDIDITPAGGTGAYAYSWTNGASSQDISALTAGTYTVTITDANLCSQNASFTVTQPAAIAIPGIVTDNICNGGSVGAIDITPADGTGAYTYLWSNGAVSQDIAGLIAGSYTVSVTDANLCSQNASFTVNEPAVISIPGVTTPVSCNTVNTGAVDITPAGGTGAYTYLWSNGAVTEDIAGLIAGTYTVTVKDANLCSNNASFTVTQPTAITIPGILTQVSCNAGSNGAIDITPANGTGPYTYSWSNGAVSEDIAGLVAGNYTVTVTDALLCSNNASFSITEPAVISIPGIINHNICNGGNIGDIDITPAGGTGAYAYSWTNGASSQDISALTAGTYTVTITDANLCSQNASFTINEPSPISVPGNITDNICNGGNIGAIDITPAGGTGPGTYTYLWSTGALVEDISALVAGTYSVTVTDGNSCSQNTSFTINEPLAIAIPGIVTDITCNGGNTGAVDITPSNGTGPGTYTYSWSNGALTEDISGLPIGSYTVTVTDANSCSKSATFNVIQSPVFSIPANITDNICNGGNIGDIDITPTGGTGPGTYSYLWSNGATTEDISGLTAGIYSVTITDANLCSQNTSFTVNQPAAISIPGNVTNNICNGGNIGDIDITPSGGTGAYTYSWSNGATSEDISALIAGTYSVIITDANLCTNSISYTVNEPAAISITGNITDVSCNEANNGAVDITPTGGTGPGTYNFTWNTGATSEDLSLLIAGTYSVIVTDANLCTNSASFIVNQPTPVTGTAIATPSTICFGDPSMVTVTLDPAFTPNANAYSFNGGISFGSINTLNIPSINSDTTISVVLKDINGCISAPLIVNITRRHFNAFIRMTSPRCHGTNTGSIIIDSVTGGTPGYAYALNGTPGLLFNNLIAGAYTLSITDASNCRFDTTLTLTEPLVLDISATFNSPICSYGNNGTVNLNASGGSLVYTFSNDKIAYVASNVFSGLNPGTYTYYVKDGNGCIDSTTTIFASYPPIIISSINANIINLTCNSVNSGQIHLSNITGGTKPLKFSLNAGPAQSDSSFIGLAEGPQTIFISDANGCSFPYNFIITAPLKITSIVGLKKLETCNNADGEFYLSTVSGGVAPYKYSLNGGPLLPYPNDTVFFSNRSSGIYTIQVFDNSIPSGCFASFPIILPKKPGPIPYIRVVDPLCYHGNDGQIKIDSLQGGAPLFNLTLNGVNLGTSSTMSGVTSTLFTGLAKDSFALTIADTECTYSMGIYYLYNEDSLYYDTIVSNYIKVNEPDTISARVFTSNTDRNLSVGVAYLYDIQGGTGPYSYSMNLAGPYTAIVKDTTNITGLAKGHYRAYIKDVNGCLGIIEFDVNGSFFIPNLITPNGDNTNDLFEITGLPRQSELRIFNRWGNRVYENKSYDNTWNGEGNPDGVYYYDIVLPDATVHKGWVEIMR